MTGVDLTGATSIYVDGKKYELSSIMAIGDVPKIDTGNDTDDKTDGETDGDDKTEGTTGTETKPDTEK